MPGAPFREKPAAAGAAGPQGEGLPPVAQVKKLLDGEEPPTSGEGDGSGDFDPRTAKTLVLRLFADEDAGTSSAQPGTLRDHEGHYRSYPAGQAVSGLYDVMYSQESRPEQVRVRLALGDAEEAADMSMPEGGGSSAFSQAAGLEIWARTSEQSRRLDR